MTIQNVHIFRDSPLPKQQKNKNKQQLNSDTQNCTYLVAVVVRSMQPDKYIFITTELLFNPFIATMSVENDQYKCKIWNPYAFLSFLE